MTSRLERRYRALLSVLPARYRAEREEEMVASFLDGRDGDLDAEYGWPGWAETGATLALAVRTRPRLRDAARQAGLFGLLLGVAMGAFSLASAHAAPVLSLWTLVAVASAGAVVAAARGAWTEARLLAAVPVLPAAAAVVVAFPPEDPPWQAVLAAAFSLPAVATALCLCAATPTRVSARWLWAAAAAAAVGALLPLTGVDPLTCAPAALLAAAALRRGRVWTDAVALSALALLPPAALLACLPGAAPRPLLIAMAAAAALAAVRIAAGPPPRRRSGPRAR
ncbi:hypothetical protein [Actinokineospora sp. UTMC 2448]|uniref:hypothetical protein n=1 Tax=Actinokineospora sp. UTMC 2448 TaxID=2268449 RepID=UPI0021644F9B|nr:hypothetical protein [Actinokineospora sp. UTMC 2448]UVS80094.1 hypothetical protein Actkin_03844 [Actinokineospora sp. UTMC 2448]